jgi:hypothetical protein
LYYDYPAIRAGIAGTIKEINGKKASNRKSFDDIMKNYSIGDNVKVKTNYDSMVNSRIVEYNNSPIDPIDSLNKNTTLFNKEYFQNYLIMFGGENPNIIDEEAVYEADFLSLKNYQTAEYDYTDATTYVQENTYIRRIYWQILTRCDDPSIVYL